MFVLDSGQTDQDRRTQKTFWTRAELTGTQSTPAELGRIAEVGSDMASGKNFWLHSNGLMDQEEFEAQFLVSMQGSGGTGRKA